MKPIKSLLLLTMLACNREDEEVFHAALLSPRASRSAKIVTWQTRTWCKSIRVLTL
jgi:hypothetical protein